MPKRYFWQIDSLSNLAILYGLCILISSFLYWLLLRGGYLNTDLLNICKQKFLAKWQWFEPRHEKSSKPLVRWEPACSFFAYSHLNACIWFKQVFSWRGSFVFQFGRVSNMSYFLPDFIATAVYYQTQHWRKLSCRLLSSSTVEEFMLLQSNKCVNHLNFHGVIFTLSIPYSKLLGHDEVYIPIITLSHATSHDVETLRSDWTSMTLRDHICRKPLY